MGAFCVAFALFGGMILIALCGIGVEWYCRREEEMAYSKENLKPQTVTQNYPKAQEQKTAARGKPVGKIDQLRSEWYNKGVF